MAYQTRLMWLVVVFGGVLLVGCRQPLAETVIVTREVVETVPVTATWQSVEDIVGFCTLVGCSDMVTITLAGNVPANFEFTINEHQAVCQNGEWVIGSLYSDGNCRTLNLPLAVMAERLDVVMRAVWQDVEAEVTAVPTYATLQPNGPDCEPTCQMGQVTFYFP